MLTRCMVSTKGPELDGWVAPEDHMADWLEVEDSTS